MILPCTGSNIPCTKFHVPFLLLMLYQSISPGPRLSLFMFCNLICFYGEELLAPLPNPKLEDNPLLAVRDYLFNVFAATLHIGGRSSICTLRTRHAMVTETHLSRIEPHLVIQLGNLQSFTSSPPYIFIVWCLRHMDNFTFTPQKLTRCSYCNWFILQSL